MFQVTSFLKTSEQLIDLDSTETKIFQLLSQAAAQAGVVVRAVGGFVRDKLLGIPSKDIDITVEGMSGSQFAKHLFDFVATNYPNQNIVSEVKNTTARPDQLKNIDVSFVNIYGNPVEILPLRGNEVYTPGDRNPTVDYNVSPRDDAFRRDLTINSLFYNLKTGKIEDFTGMGHSDLTTMTLRTPLDPQQTFLDDPLRVLRILRFYSRYGNARIDDATIQGMTNPDVQHQLTRKIANPSDQQGIVTERTSEELRKIMKGSRPEAAMRVMYETGLLQKMLNLPQSFNPLNMDQRNQHHQMTVIDHTLQVMKNVNILSKKFGLDENQRMMMNICALFHDLGKLDPRSHVNKPDGSRGYSGNKENGITHEQSSGDVWNNFSKALGMTNEEQTTIHDLIVGHMNPHSQVGERGEGSVATDKQLRKYVRKNPSWMFQYIHAMADAMSKTIADEEPNSNTTNKYEENINRIKTLIPTIDQYGRQPKSNDLLNGGEIMNMVGLPAQPPPGMPGYIEIVKEHIRDIQDENPNFSKEDAFAELQNMINKGIFSQYQQYFNQKNKNKTQINK